MKKHVIIPVFIPHKGCPFDCIFCNQKTISGQVEEMTAEKMIKVIEEHLLSIDDRNTYVEIAFFGGSFTGIETRQQIEYLSIAAEYADAGRVQGIRLSTRPDYINNEILDYLRFYKVRTIELGVQSLDKEVLDKSCRGHSAEDVYASSGLIKEAGFALGIQTMIGLPGDSREKALDTANRVIGLRPDMIRIYPALVIKNTYMEKLYESGRYFPVSLEAAVELCAELLRLYNENGINVIRIGLQPSENINNGMDVVAGPFHPAFRQLVESKLLLDRIDLEIAKNGFSGKEQIAIHAERRMISDIVGQKRANVEFLKKKYNFRRIKVVESDKLLKGNFIITDY